MRYTFMVYIGASGHRLGGGDALDRTRRRAEERSGVYTEAALQLLASPYGLRDTAWLPLSGEGLVGS
jgi:hypothetical protein